MKRLFYFLALICFICCSDGLDVYEMDKVSNSYKIMNKLYCQWFTICNKYKMEYLIKQVYIDTKRLQFSIS